jgi:hypothetical protein
MGFDRTELSRVLGHSVVFRPTYVPTVDLLHRLFQRERRTPRGQLFHFLQGSFHRLCRYHQRSFDDGHTEKLDLPAATHLAFRTVDFQLELRFNEFADTAHDSFGCLGRSNEYIAVIRKSAKLKPPSFQFLIQFVEHDIAQQGTQRAPLDRSFLGSLKHPVFHDPASQNHAD